MNLELSDYDLRTVGHLAAAEGHAEMVEFLLEKTNFNFELKDRWEHDPMEGAKDNEIKSAIKLGLKLRDKKR